MNPAFLAPVSLSSPKRPFPQTGISRTSTKQDVPRVAVIRAIADPTSRTAETHNKVSDATAANVMNTYSRFPISVSHGEGVYLYDVEGNCYLDGIAGIATCTLGHAHPAIVNAISKQIGKVSHVSNIFYVPEQAHLANWLVENSPADKVLFSNSGAEANEGALKLMRKNWHIKNGSTPSNHGKPVIITANKSFHGRTIATLSATGQEKFHQNQWPIVEGFEYVDYNNVEQLQAICARVGNNLAGIMLEALQGEGGVRPATSEFMQAARTACDAVGALLVCDEVQVGMGRTGHLWGFENTGVTPDVFTLAKGLGGGVPIGAMLTQEHCNVFGPGEHGSTFGGNPLAMAAGSAVASQLMEGGVLDNSKARGEQLGRSLNAIAQKYPDLVKEVRGWGLIRGIEFWDEIAKDVVMDGIKRKLLLLPTGPSIIRIVPALTVTEGEVEEMVSRFEEAIVAVAK